MTHRNESKMMYGRLILNGNETVDLGRTTMLEMTQRATAVMKSRIDIQIEYAQLLAAESKESLAKMLKGGVQAEYAHEGLDPNSPLYGLDADVVASIQMIDDDTPSPFEGITMTRLMEAQGSPEYKAYAVFALHPDKRVGVSPDVVGKLHDDWREAYPDVSARVPRWVD